MNQTYLKLNDGNVIPQFGMGVYQVQEGGVTVNAVSEASNHWFTLSFSISTRVDIYK